MVTCADTALLAALKEMPGTLYNDLCFRYAVMGRPTGQLQTPPSQALVNAEREDVEQMLAFIRALDRADEVRVL